MFDRFPMSTEQKCWFSTIQTSSYLSTLINMLWIFILQCLPMVMAAAGIQDINRVSFWDMQKSSVSAQKIKAALSSDGIFAIEDVPDLQVARKQVLSNPGFPTKIEEDDDDQLNLYSKTFPDGTKRFTVAAESYGGSRKQQLQASLNPKTSLGFTANSLSTIVDDTAKRLASALDGAFPSVDPFFQDNLSLSSDGVEGQAWMNFKDIMQGGSFLEHLHSYRTDIPKTVASADRATIEYHTDAGLFIMFVPALYTADINEIQEKPSDFRFLDRNGQEHAIVVSQKTTPSVAMKDDIIVHTVSPDSLVVMMGQGAELYLNPHLNAPLRAVPHALSVTNAGERNWYGRMYLPPRDAWLTEQQSTYGDLRSRLVAQSQQQGGNAQLQEIAMPVGCGIGRAYTPSDAAPAVPYYNGGYLRALPLMDNSADDCVAGEIYCWATCQSISAYNLTCPVSEVTCVDTDGNPADPTLHVPSNQPGCVGVPIADPGGYCQGTGVNMYMEGFVSYVTGQYRQDGGSTTPQCLVLWFEDWVLDSAGKFAAACFGCMFLGVLTESITVVRRYARELTRGKAVVLQTCVMSLLYTIQVMFGYFSMLVAMTYQVELFVCIVVGLGLGHAIFNFKPALALSGAGGQVSQTEKILRAAQELDDVVDPCCQYLHLDDDSTHSQTTTTTQQQRSPMTSTITTADKTYPKQTLF